MLFFSSGLDAFTEGFNTLFQLDNQEESKEKSKDGRTIQETANADKTFNLMSLIYQFSSFTGIDWDRVWDKNIVEFFNIIAFIKEYKRREEEAIKKKRNI